MYHPKTKKGHLRRPGQSFLGQKQEANEDYEIR